MYEYLISVSMAELLWHPLSIMKNNYVHSGKIDFANKIKSQGIMFYYRTSPIIITKQIICIYK